MTVQIYGTIGSGLFGDIDESGVEDQLEEEDGDEITVAINSHGGDLFEGLGINSLLQRRDETIIAHIDGLAASAASIIAMAADEIRMPESSMMMIHNAWMMVVGDHNDLREVADDVETMNEGVISAYSRADLDEDQIRQKLDAETWMSAQDAVDDGFADTIISEDAEDDVAAAVVSQINARRKSELTDFERVPAAVAQMAYRTGQRVAAMGGSPAASTNTQTQGADEMPDQNSNGEPESAPEEDETTVDAEANTADRETEATDVSDIRTQCQNAGLDPEATLDVVEKAESQDHANELIINRLSEEDEAPDFQGRSSITVGETDDEKHREAMSEAILMRAGVKDRDRANPYVGMRLERMAEECVTRAGMSKAANRLEFGKQAFNQVAPGTFAAGGSGTPSTSDFPNILEDTINKQMLVGWDQAPETWDTWTRTGSLSDFRQASRTSLNLMDELEEIDEGEEYSRGTTSDRKETIQLGKYGKIYSISWEAVVNDDLGAFTRRPQKIGRRAAALPGDLAYEVLTDNPTMNETGNTLFHGNHNNDAGGALSHDELEDMIERMRTQKAPTSGKNYDDDENRTLNLQPEYLLVPIQLEFSAQKIIESPGIEGESGDVVNPVQNMLQIVGEPRLSDDDTSTYYMVADPVMFDTVEVAFLDGQTEPYMDVRDGWDIDGTEIKVRLPCAAAPLDYRTFQRGNN